MKSFLLSAVCALSAASLSLPAAYGVATAKDDVAHSTNGQPVTIPVLANDTSSTKQALTLVEIKPLPTHGTATFSSDKTMVVYTPDAGLNSTFMGTDSFGYTCTDGDGNPAGATVKIQNTPIQANDDSATIPAYGPSKINVLKNDVDPDGNTLSIKQFTQGSAGRVTRGAQAGVLIYTPALSFSGSDSFTYTVQDGYATAKATVRVYSPQAAAAGAIGISIIDANKKIVGALNLQILPLGVFSGRVTLRGTRYALLGRFDLERHFQGFAYGSHGMFLPVSLSLSAESPPVLSAVFPSGDTSSQAISTMTAVGRELTRGRFTVQLPSGAKASSSNIEDGSVPSGTGWMSIRINAQGFASITGVAGDGSKFSSSGVLGGSDAAPSLVVYANPEASALAGTLSIGDKVSGAFTYSRDASDRDFYPDGFEIDVTATGARYAEPDHRPFDQFATFATSGGRFTDFSTDVRVTEDGSSVVQKNVGNADLSLQFNSRIGSFSGDFRNPDHSHRLARFSGVIVQGSTEKGAGVFRGESKAGLVTLTATSTSVVTTTPTPGSGAGAGAMVIGTNTSGAGFVNTGNGVNNRGISTVDPSTLSNTPEQP